MSVALELVVSCRLDLASTANGRDCGEDGAIDDSRTLPLSSDLLKPRCEDSFELWKFRQNVKAFDFSRVLSFSCQTNEMTCYFYLNVSGRSQRPSTHYPSCKDASLHESMQLIKESNRSALRTDQGPNAEPTLGTII